MTKQDQSSHCAFLSTLKGVCSQAKAYWNRCPSQGVVFLLREHFRSLGSAKLAIEPLVAPIYAAAGILCQNGKADLPDELKFWWQ